MPYLLWDASALAKRYAKETGSDTVKALFDGVERDRIVTAIWGYIETFSILWRRFNGGVIRRASFIAAASALRTEIIASTETSVLTIDDATILGSLNLMQKHNLNSTDAAILNLFLRYKTTLPEPCLLISADKRLVRAANAEGLTAIDPENFPAADAPAFLATL